MLAPRGPAIAPRTVFRTSIDWCRANAMRFNVPVCVVMDW